MENTNRQANPEDWRDAEHQGDWQLSEAQAEDTAEMLTTYQAEVPDDRLYATGGNPDDEDREDDDRDDDEEAPREWGQTDPFETPLPDSNDPSGPGSAV